jgi:small subunit ribosomal protein S19e
VNEYEEKMVNFNDCDTNQLIENVAKEIKKSVPEVKAPEWSMFVKTGMQAERAPDNADWWYVRSAAILRKVAILGPIGVSKLRVKFGGKKHRGVQPEEFRKSGGKIIRVILQQLEKAQLIKSVNKSGRKGRVITPKGISLIDKQAIALIKNIVREEKPKDHPAAKPKVAHPAVKKEALPVVVNKEVPAEVPKP